MNTNITDVDFRSIYSSEAEYPVSEQYSFYGMKLLASRPTPSLGDQGTLRLAPTP
jgi:hypothetical protein